MKIGVDATPLTDQQTGIGNYTHYLLKELIQARPQDIFYLYAIKRTENIQLLMMPNVILRVHSFLGFSEALWSQTTLAALCRRDKLDIFWGTTQAFPLFCEKKQKNLLTVHDFAYLLYPKTVSWVRGFFLKIVGERFYRSATAIVANSSGTALKLENLFQKRADAIIPPPIRNLDFLCQESLLKRYNLRDKGYFLIAATLEPRKNLLAALQAYCELLKSTKLEPIVLVGKKGWRDGKIKKELKEMAAANPNEIKILGYLPDKELNTLVKSAKALILPSLYEGYGMPLAEARILGTQVIYTDIPEMIEAAEGDGVQISSAHFKSSFHQALQRVLPPLQPASYPSNSHLAGLVWSLLAKLGGA
jgi:glycosyltransferase involved in cell wall biosynthesis